MTDANMKRINIQIDEELHRQMKIAAATEGVTLLKYVSEAIEEKIERDKEGK